MGLDVYLYPKRDHELNAAYWAAWNAEYESFEAMTPEQRAQWDADHPQAGHVDVKSEAYPEHMFNRRYLRSSYNGGGFNNAVPEMVGADHGLYWIFEPVRKGEEDADLTAESLPALAECRGRALQVVEELRACDRLRTMTIEPNMFRGPQPDDADGALKLFREHVGKDPAQWAAYAESKTCYASVRDSYSGPRFCVHLIYRTADIGFDYYLQAAEITVDFCDEAVALVERDGAAFMSWSG